MSPRHRKVSSDSRRSTAYDNDFSLKRHLDETRANPVIEGSNIGVRRQQMQGLFAASGYDPLAVFGKT